MKNGILSIALSLLATAAAQAAPIADSQADYSSTQGYKGWYYGYYTSNFDTPNYTTFTQYDTYTPTGWVAWSSTVADYGFVNQSQMVPGANNSSDAVRRWVSTVNDTIHISGTLQKAEAGSTTGAIEGWNNGARIRIYVNGNNVGGYTNYLGWNDLTLYSYTTSAVVAIGDKVDFVIDPYWNSASDRATFTATIVPEPGMLALLAVSGVLVLKRRRV